LLVSLPIPEDHFRPFPAKYVLARAAAALAAGTPLEALGAPTDQFERKLFKKAVYETNQIKGYVVHVDHYGNLITNITREHFLRVAQGRRFNIRFEYENIQGISAGYGSKEYGDCLVIFNSNHCLEIAINHGHAAQLLGMQFDSSILIDFTPKL
jgi:S-adenosylmethionine hydrolase